MKLLYLLCVAAFLGSFAGAWHPALDALSVLRVPLSVLLVLAVLVRRARLTGVIAALAAASLAWNHVLWPLGVGRNGDMTLYQQNLWFHNTSLDALEREISLHDPHVITLQEVSPTNIGLLERLQTAYPHQHVCSYGTRYSIAVLSRLPPTGAKAVCSRRRGMAAMEVMAPTGPGWIVSLHLFWPWPYGQGPELADIAQEIAELPGPVVVAGDFNNLPWSYAVRRLKDAASADYLGPRRQTFDVRGIPLPIDHVLGPSGHVARLEGVGGDHMALFARVSFQ